MIDEKYLHSDLTDKIIGCFFTVYNQLRYGFLERVYENALKYELEKKGFKVEPQKRIEVFYDGIRVGEYYADLLVNDLIIVELKAADELCLEHSFQLLNYLRATSIEVGLLLNFGKTPRFVRKSFLNKEK
jgi:GxxExxY protein